MSSRDNTLKNYIGDIELSQDYRKIFRPPKEVVPPNGSSSDDFDIDACQEILSASCDIWLWWFALCALACSVLFCPPCACFPTIASLGEQNKSKSSVVTNRQTGKVLHWGRRYNRARTWAVTTCSRQLCVARFGLCRIVTKRRGASSPPTTELSTYALIRGALIQQPMVPLNTNVTSRVRQTSVHKVLKSVKNI